MQESINKDHEQRLKENLEQVEKEKKEKDKAIAEAFKKQVEEILKPREEKKHE